MSSYPSRSAQPEDLPPKVPEDVETLHRVVCLLGNRLASDLKDRTKSELVFLIGIYPTMEQASRWKKSLKRRIKEMTGAVPIVPEVQPKPKSKEELDERKRRRKKRSQRAKTRAIEQPKPDWLRNDSDWLESGVSNMASIDVSRFQDDRNEWWD